MTKNYDLIVIGGGPGGLPAAIAAARAGLKVLLVERSAALGGLANSGLPLLGFVDRAGDHVVGGIPQEFVDRLAELDMGLLATEATGYNTWDTMDWAIRNMNEITEDYSLHIYDNSHKLDDLSFYDFFYFKCNEQVMKAIKTDGKRLILAEMGIQDGVQAEEGKLTWEPVSAPNHCYYRIFVNGVQIASTVACDLPIEDEAASYQVLSVDQWGNV